MTNRKVLQKLSNGNATGLITLLVPAALWFAVTLPALGQSAPFAHTQAAGPITATNAMLNGMVVPNGTNTVAWFEWGQGGSYGNATIPVEVGAGGSVIRVSGTIDGLISGVIYNCRLVASNDLGVVRGCQQRVSVRGVVVGWGSDLQQQAKGLSSLDHVVSVAAGTEHSMALDSKGRPWAYGANSAGQSIVPAGLSNIVAISAGGTHCLALNENGTVAQWGGATSLPAGISNVVALAGGQGFSVALFSNGNLAQWGGTAPPVGISNVVAIAAGSSHTLVLRADGTISQWGSATSPPAGLSNVVAIAAGQGIGLALSSDGMLTQWGGTAPPAGISNVVAIAMGAGAGHALALREDGVVQAWGSNTYGQTNVPAGLSNVVSIAAAGSHCLALVAEAPPQTPFATTRSALATSSTAASLEGMATPNGMESFAWFEWGTNTSFGRSSSPVGVGAGYDVVRVSEIAAGLLPGLTWNYRLVVSNASGVVFGRARRFVTQGYVTSWGLIYPSYVPSGLSAVAVDGGQSHALVLRRDGSVASFGTEPAVPASVTNVVSIAAGINCSAAVLADSSVVTWGAAPIAPTVVTNVVQVAAGSQFAAALIKDGTVKAWGITDGRAPAPPLQNMVSVACGLSHGLALRNDGRVFAWGSNGYGQRNVPGDLTNAVAIAALGNWSLALRSDGRVVAWGSNSSGVTNIPSSVSNVVEIAAGGSLGLALREDGTIAKWGSGSTPSAYSNVVALDAGDNAGIVLLPKSAEPAAFTQEVQPLGEFSRRLAGMVVPNGATTMAWFEWGTNGVFSEASNPIDAGEGDSVVRFTNPVSNLVMGVTYQFRVVASNALGVAVGASRVFAAHGSAVAWGNNNYGQATVYPSANAEIAMAAGATHTLSLTTDGGVSAAGQFSVNFPAMVPAGLSNVVAIGSGVGHGLAVRGGGTVAAWGANATATNVPPGLSNVIAVAGGQDHSLALRGDGFVVAWGNNTYGQTNVPVGLSNVVAVAAGDQFCLALRADGRITPWGRNDFGQTNIPTSLGNVTAIAAGATHGLALRSGGTVVAWSTIGGQTNVPVGLSNVVAIAAGRYHSLALKSDGTVVAWGQNTYGQTNVPVAASNCVAIAGGEQHSVAISIQIVRPRAAIPWAHLITPTTAKLAGFVSPNGLESTAWFEWWQRGGAVTNFTPAESVGSRTKVVYQTADIVGLVEGGIYHCRSVISNEAGVVSGPPAAFTTGQKVTAWGSDFLGQTTVPAGLSNVVSVAAGQYHAVAIKNDGTLVGWGWGGAAFPPEATNVVALAGGSLHTVALRADGTVVQWGSFSPAPAGLSNVVAITANQYFTAALKSDGTVSVWGGAILYPPSMTNIVAISAASSKGIFVREDGGFEVYGPSGLLSAPAQDDYVSIVGGSMYSVGLRRDGRLRTSVPGIPPPADFTNVLSIAAGTMTFYGLGVDGTVRAWGANSIGQTNVPPGLNNAASVVSYSDTAYALGADVPPIVSAGTFNGYVNADLRISLPARDPNGDPITFRIATLPTAGALYQYDAGVRGAAITAPDTSVSDSSGRVIFVPATDGVGTPHATFGFLVNDGLADSPTATVAVNIALPPVPSIGSTNSNWGLNLDGAFALSFTGNSNAAYSVYGSTNLIHWERLGAATPLSNGWFQFLDSAATNWPQRYYRAGAP